MSFLRAALSSVCCTSRTHPKKAAGDWRSWVSFASIVTIKVQLPSSSVFELEIAEDATVEAAKRLLEAALDIPWQEQALRDGVWGTLLNDEQQPFAEAKTNKDLFFVLVQGPLHEACSSWCRFRYCARGPDADCFDRASVDDDLGALVGLMRSKEPVEFVEEPKHPWALDPRTIGALAGSHIASAASSGLCASETASTSDGEQESERKPDVVKIKQTVCELGIAPILVDFLKSGEEDKAHVAVLALRFLTAEPEGDACAQAAYQAGAMPLLIDMLLQSEGPLCSAATSALRNIFMLDDQHREDFVKLGGLKGIIRQIRLAPRTETESMLEAVLNLQDLLEDSHGSVNERFCMLAVELGVIELLHEMQASASDDFHSLICEVNGVLEDVQHRHSSANCDAPSSFSKA